MAYTRDDWRAAKAALDAIDAERAAMVAHTDERFNAALEFVEVVRAERDVILEPTSERYQEAEEKLDEVTCGLGDLYAACESCDEPIFDGEPRMGDIDNGIFTCKACSPTWAAFEAHPEDFLNVPASDDADDTIFFTAETAKPLIDAHLAAGGSLSDSLAR